MMRRLFAMVSLSVAFSVSHAEPTLADAYRTMLQTHPVIKAAEARVQSRNASLDAVKATRLPKLDANASYQYLSETARLQMEIPAVVPGMQPIRIDRPLGDHDKAELGVTASYAIFTGYAQMNSIAAQGFAVQASSLDQSQLRQNLSFQFGMLHYGIQMAVVEARLRASRLDARRMHVKTLETEANGGVATLAQVLSARAEFARSTADTASTRRTMDSLGAEFFALTSCAYPEGAGAEFKIPTEIGEPKSLQAESYEMQARALEKSGEVATSAKYPWVSAFAGYRYGNPGLNQSADVWMGYAIVGVQAQWNIFDGFERKSTQARFRADSRAMQAEAARVRLAQSATLATLMAERSASATEADALASGLEASRAARDAYKAALGNGFATADDVLDAEIRVAEFEARLEQWKIRDAMIDLRMRWNAGQLISFSENNP